MCVCVGGVGGWVGLGLIQCVLYWACENFLSYLHVVKLTN